MAKFSFNPLTGLFDFAAPIQTNSFETIQVPNGTSPVAETSTDILTLAEGDGISISGNSATDTVTIENTDFDKLTSVMGTGLLNGGVLSINVDPTKFDISAGNGYVVDNHTDPDNPVRTHVVWSAFTAQTVTNIATASFTNIAINSAGAIVQQTASFSIDDSRDYIILGRLVHANLSTITVASPFPRVIFNASMDADDFSNIVGVVIGSGNVISANGANLNLNKSSGTSYRNGSNYYTSKKNPNITADAALVAPSFSYSYRNGSGGFTQTSPSALVTPDLYDDGTGVLATVPNNKFTIQRVYHANATNILIMTYGQVIYNDLNEARLGVLSETPIVAPSLSDTALRAWLIVKKNTTALNTAADAVFVAASKFGEPATAGGGSGGDVVGPASSTDNAVARFDSTTGKILQDGANSTIDDAGNMVLAGTITATNIVDLVAFTQFGGF